LLLCKYDIKNYLVCCTWQTYWFRYYHKSTCCK